MNGSRRVFLVPSGYNFRAVLAFCRALQDAGHTPAVVACTTSDPIFNTRFASNVVFTRTSRTLELDDFARAARAACGLSRADRCVLAPTSEFFVRWAYRNRAGLEDVGCDLPLPAESAYLTVTDKAAFTRFARERGLAVPAEIPSAAALRLPAVAKPRQNVSPDGRSLYPWLLRTAADLERFSAQEHTEDFFFQEWIEGRSFYLLFHLPQHGAATVYSQENLAQQPGGKSIVLARGARLHETAEADRWADALRAAGFHGLVMVELRQRDSEYVLIEANPRLWGPLQLCLEGCPALLMNYIAEQTGLSAGTAEIRPGTNHPYYLWLGGVSHGVAADWHGEVPAFPRLRLLSHLGADVYFRRDSWRHFFAERRRPSAAPAARELRPVPVPAVS